MENIIAGLVSGIFVVIIVFLFKTMWDKIVVPWFEDRVYKDARIEGAWFGVYPELDDIRQDVVSIKRAGHFVSGTIICTVSSHDCGCRYKVEGSFRNMILPLIYEADDAASTDRGTITLKVTDGGKRMEGKVAVYSNNEDAIDSWDVLWFREKSAAEAFVTELRSQSERIADYREQKAEIDALGRAVIEDCLWPDEKNPDVEQGGTGKPATRIESKSEGGDKPQPEAEGRSR